MRCSDLAQMFFFETLTDLNKTRKKKKKKKNERTNEERSLNFILFFIKRAHTERKSGREKNGSRLARSLVDNIRLETGYIVH